MSFNIVKTQLDKFKNIHSLCKTIELITILTLQFYSSKMIHGIKMIPLIFCYIKECYRLNNVLKSHLVIPFFSDKSCSGIINNNLLFFLKETFLLMIYNNVLASLAGTSLNFKKNIFFTSFSESTILNLYNLSSETVNFYSSFLVFKEILLLNYTMFYLLFNESLSIYYQVVNYYLIRSLNDFIYIYFSNLGNNIIFNNSRRCYSKKKKKYTLTEEYLRIVHYDIIFYELLFHKLKLTILVYLIMLLINWKKHYSVPTLFYTESDFRSSLKGKFFFLSYFFLKLIHIFFFKYILYEYIVYMSYRRINTSCLNITNVLSRSSVFLRDSSLKKNLLKGNIFNMRSYSTKKQINILSSTNSINKMNIFSNTKCFYNIKKKKSILKNEDEDEDEDEDEYVNISITSSTHKVTYINDDDFDPKDVYKYFDSDSKNVYESKDSYTFLKSKDSDSKNVYTFLESKDSSSKNVYESKDSSSKNVSLSKTPFWDNFPLRSAFFLFYLPFFIVKWAFYFFLLFIFIIFSYIYYFLACCTNYFRLLDRKNFFIHFSFFIFFFILYIFFIFVGSLFSLIILITCILFNFFNLFYERFLYVEPNINIKKYMYSFFYICIIFLFLYFIPTLLSNNLGISFGISIKCKLFMICLIRLLILIYNYKRYERSVSFSFYNPFFYLNNLFCFSIDYLYQNKLVSMLDDIHIMLLDSMTLFYITGMFNKIRQFYFKNKKKMNIFSNTKRKFSTKKNIHIFSNTKRKFSTRTFLHFIKKYTQLELFIHYYIMLLFNNKYVNLSLLCSIIYGLLAYLFLFLLYIFSSLYVLIYYLFIKKNLKLFYKFIYNELLFKILFLILLKIINSFLIIPIYLIYRIIKYILENEFKPPYTMTSILIYIGTFLRKPINNLKNKIISYSNLISTNE